MKVTRPPRRWRREELKFWPRFWRQVDKKGFDECWLWTGSKNPVYGIISVTNASRKAHRIAYLLARGAILRDNEIDHLCKTPACVNPNHLRQVPRWFNMKQGQKSRAAYQRSKTHCPQGHPYSGDNLYVASRGDRQCRTCLRERSTRRKTR